MNTLILNSAQSKYPCGSDPWIRMTEAAFDSIATYPGRVICSTEPSTWDIATYFAGRKACEILLIIKATEDDGGRREYQKILGEYDLDSKRTVPYYQREPDRKSPKKAWRQRDKVAVSMAHTILPVSIRPGGKLERLIAEKCADKTISNEFTTEWTQRRPTNPPDYSIRTVKDFPNGEWIIHWTRASNGQWPGERACDYFRDLLLNPDSYVRGALATLIRIVSEKMVRGSARHMKHGEKAVSLSSLVGRDAVELMRWRKRLVQYTFEPYGIGIKRDALTDLGGREVDYTLNPQSDSPEETSIFTQSPGTRADWTKEKEWRLPGDLHLEQIAAEDLIAVVPDRESAEIFNAETDGSIGIHTLFSD